MPDSSAAPPADGAADAAADGEVLVRLPVSGRHWPDTLPPVPGAEVLTITVGHPGLLPTGEQELIAAGYRIVGVRSSRGAGATIDVLVPGALRRDHARWWRQLAAPAERIFDLRLGPVQLLFGPQLARHRSLAAPPRHG